MMPAARMISPGSILPHLPSSKWGAFEVDPIGEGCCHLPPVSNGQSISGSQPCGFGFFFLHFIGPETFVMALATRVCGGTGVG